MLKKTELFKKELKNINVKDIIVLDESGCNLNMTLPYARAEGGTRIKCRTSITFADRRQLCLPVHKLSNFRSLDCFFR